MLSNNQTEPSFQAGPGRLIDIPAAPVLTTDQAYGSRITRLNGKSLSGNLDRQFYVIEGETHRSFRYLPVNSDEPVTVTIHNPLVMASDDAALYIIDNSGTCHVVQRGFFHQEWRGHESGQQDTWFLAQTAPYAASELA